MKISIITASFNAAETIDGTIRSVAAQDHPSFEHIVIDGASRDSTMAVVAALRHDRLDAVSEPDGGCYDAMNKGLGRATGDIVAFINADDFLVRPDALSLIARRFADSDADCVGGGIVVVDRTDVASVKRVYRSEGFRPWMLRLGHMPPHPAFFARRATLEKAGGFDCRFRMSADFDLIARLLLGRHPASFETVAATITAFRNGGLSTRDLAARGAINRDIQRSLRQFGLGAPMPLLLARYLIKPFQRMGHVDDYPWPDAGTWA